MICDDLVKKEAIPNVPGKGAERLSKQLLPLATPPWGTAMQREAGWPRMACCRSNWRRQGSEQNNNSNNALAGGRMATGLSETANLTFKCSPTTDVFFISFYMILRCVFCILYRNISN